MLTGVVSGRPARCHGDRRSLRLTGRITAKGRSSQLKVRPQRTSSRWRPWSFVGGVGAVGGDGGRKRPRGDTPHPRSTYDVATSREQGTGWSAGAGDGVTDFLPGFDRRSIPVGDGAVISLRTAGRGPAVLLMHGYPFSSSTWHAVAPGLAERFT